MLFSPLALGELELSNRLVMAPLTRLRAGQNGVPGPLIAEHYRQRASLGLIVSEGTYPVQAGQSYPGQPGLVTEEQIAGWKAVTDAVHAEGGRIFAQVMHGGRVSHADITSGHEIVGPSAVAIDGDVRTPNGKQPYPVPRELGTDELPGVIQEIVTASKNAIEAGFDGVELHSANGYLLHEFLAPNSNIRTDSYGGSPENRARFVIETVNAVVEALGANRVGIRISPEHNVQGIAETDPADVRATYQVLVDTIAPLNLAYLSILHHDPKSGLVQDLRERFNGTFLVNTGFGEITTREEAFAIIDNGLADAVVVGRPAIANPDLARRWRESLPLNEPDASTFYADGAEGYTDYPFYAN
ncbi:2,4-dienoyl-CoA reductase-like NADH-dependent reductase (Old Yellow Enzyme family) [Paenarthrobacter nicotinovorans]|uniref:alkene reductase n=1 Tax=Micrococcaceae TaxID=1268 RepID=UPI00047E3CC5|nr:MULTISPECIES: alkene reductase [Micrococcaceae]MDR6436975.1 2,4-dienoyl-CoA reductase-like NADH-dependent reductase (Old Yellow Enzyme family) [Paenarthrobacter nicotinovorans]SCZ55030.1 2,4-dienoyl-CoA reductase [Arthrobacter sp. UNCCL28]